MADESVAEVEYRAIQGFEAYRVGSDGSVWSRWKKTQAGYRQGTRRFISDEWTRMKPAIKKHKSGKSYQLVTLYREGGRHLAKRFMIHHLVLGAFAGPRPNGTECCHKNDQSLDNRLNNLKWGTTYENKADAIANGLIGRGETHAQSIHTNEQIKTAILMIQDGKTSAEIIQATGLKSHIVADVRGGASWTHLWADGWRYIPSPNRAYRKNSRVA